jgi:hypothetical protein
MEWEVIGEGVCGSGGVRPREPAPTPDSRLIGVSVPSRDTEWSEEDRSAATGLFENNRRNAEPTLEERFLPLWISPVSTSPLIGRAEMANHFEASPLQLITCRYLARAWKGFLSPRGLVHGLWLPDRGSDQ